MRLFPQLAAPRPIDFIILFELSIARTYQFLYSPGSIPVLNPHTSESTFFMSRLLNNILWFLNKEKVRNSESVRMSTGSKPETVLSILNFDKLNFWTFLEEFRDAIRGRKCQIFIIWSLNWKATGSRPDVAYIFSLFDKLNF